jgi:hypothetical protein
VSRPLAIAALAAALALVAAGSAAGHRREAARRLSPLPSSESTGPRGLAAARAFLLARGHAAPRLASARDAPARAAVVILAAPGAPLDGAEADALLAHAAAGGTLVWAAGGAPQPALAARLRATASPARGSRIAGPLEPHPLLGGLALPAGDGTVSSALPGARPVSGAPGRPFAVAIPHGRGEVILLAGPEPLENAGLARADALSLLVRLAARGPVAFDERWLLPRGAGGAPPPALALLAGQALLAAGVLLVARGRRLGAIRPPAAARGRTSADRLASLAALYRRAGAEAELAAAAWRGARRRLERSAGVPARLEDPRALALLRVRAPAAAGPFERGAAALRAAPGPASLLAVVRASAELDEALRARASGTPRRAW